jgi:hypothetical protein
LPVLIIKVFLQETKSQKWQHIFYAADGIQIRASLITHLFLSSRRGIKGEVIKIKSY